VSGSSAHYLRIACLVVLVAGMLTWLARGVEADLTRERNLHQVAYAGSASCLRCHRDHDASWRRTFHRTMTQEANTTSVRGDFSGQELQYFGVRARMERGPRGEYSVRYEGPGLPARRFVVQKTVGSRRYQQYLAPMGDALVRQPVAYDLEANRWFHMNGAFLTPDPDADAPLSALDYERHLTRWNDNCVFCHNVAPNPGKQALGFEVNPASRTARFDTEVAELGIACEACHGPGAEHAKQNQNPWRRFRLHLSETADPTIVNPARLSHERSADLCGRCHGQRITDDVDTFLAHGDPFVPGEDLALYSAPLWRDTTLREEAGVFEPRFWGDGTARLTAYEYQGLLQSPCFQRGELTCIDCHGMHEGDPRGQLREFASEGKRDAMCTNCHEKLAAPSARVAHARHGDTPPDCVSCHMPPIVYGVLSTHPSHRIELPDPAKAARDGRPDACTLCHTDRTRAWAVRERAHLFGRDSGALPGETAWSEVETQLLAGDPIERAIAAQALGRAKTRKDPWTAALLLEVMEHDDYPVVRRFAARALAELRPDQRGKLSQFVPEVPARDRARFVGGLRTSLPPLPALPEGTLIELRSQASARAIDIGE
jgi:hypothetical protein